MNLGWNTTRTLALPDYLWGIETSDRHIHLIRHHRFQTTYEELKRTNLGWVETTWASFQTTYEELKPAVEPTKSLRKKQLPDYLWGIETRGACDGLLGRSACFQTTYEELKLYDMFSEEKHVVARLPDYLWGIETSIALYINRTPKKLPDYLWGIETGSL